MVVSGGWEWQSPGMTDKIKVVRLGSALVCGTWADCFFEHEFLSNIECFWHTDRILSLNTNSSNSTNVFGIRIDLPCGGLYIKIGIQTDCEQDGKITSLRSVGLRQISRFVRFERLLPFGQWVFDKSRVQRKIHPLSIRVLSGILLNSADE